MQQYPSDRVSPPVVEGSAVCSVGRSWDGVAEFEVQGHGWSDGRCEWDLLHGGRDVRGGVLGGNLRGEGGGCGSCDGEGWEFVEWAVGRE